MIRASEANKQTTKNIEDKLTTEIKDIEQRIISQINEGSYTLSLSGYLSSTTKQCLEQLGYRVETGSQYNEPYYTISWK